MSKRSQKRIRRDLKRLKGVVDEHAVAHAELDVIKEDVDQHVEAVDTTWRASQAASIKSTKELKERDVAATPLLKWARSWRGVIKIKVPGASANIRELPTDGATPDDVINQASDIQALISTNPAAAPFRERALAKLGTKLEDAKRENTEAKAAVPAKEQAEDAFAEATLAANFILVEGSRIVRNIFGPKSYEYKRLITRKRTKEEEEEDAEDEDDDEDDEEETNVTT